MTGADPVGDDVVAMLEAGLVVCRAWPEQEEGPYHGNAQPLRRDVVEDRPGAPLRVGIRLVGQDGAVLRHAEVEIWHCDAFGRYSGFPPPDPSSVVTAETAPRPEYLPGETFLRGRQRTDAAGVVEFRTIYPGWYPGRTVHIHVSVHTRGAVFTSQLYFPDSLTDDVFAQAPYRERPRRDTRNENDEIFPTGGEPALLEVIPVEGGHLSGVCLLIPSPVGGAS